ncbi:helix-turn-helix domain-containing protein [Streptomyces sp. NPDC001156]
MLVHTHAHSCTSETEQLPTPRGAAERDAIEAETDAAAEGPWRAVGRDATVRLAELLTPLARKVLASGVIPSGNPVGLTWAPRCDSGGAGSR